MPILFLFFIYLTQRERTRQDRYRKGVLGWEWKKEEEQQWGFIISYLSCMFVASFVLLHVINTSCYPIFGL